MYEVHLNSGSKKDEQKALELVKRFGGKFGGATDKGAIFGFGRPADRSGFIYAVNVARLSCTADEAN